MLCLAHEPVAQHAETGEFYLNDIAMLQIW
jgi:hypothetical protein